MMDRNQVRRRLPPLNALRAFEAAARHLNFSRAADELSVTPGAVRWAGPPRPGSHNNEVYQELLGLSVEELTDLTAAGVI